MSRRPIARSADLSLLLAEGYNLSVRDNYLAVGGIPYVKTDKSVAYGTLVTALKLRNDITEKPDDHTILFVGDYPCDEQGRPIEAIRSSTNPVSIAEGLVATQRFSAKPQTGHYDDYYHKVVTYAAILSGPAQRLDPDVRPNPGAFAGAGQDDDSIFIYLDTASPRAEIMEATKKLERRKLVIIGLGGTGGYVFDFVAKTPVDEIHLYDGDLFHQHNAFRAPGAASGEELESAPTKVAYFEGIYSKMRRGIVAHPCAVDASNIDELRDADFVFLCIDEGPAKRFIIEKLEEFGRSFVDVGMGIFMRDGALDGNLRATASTPEKRDHLRNRISFAAADEENDYDRNIQVADLNAFNAIMAVIKWKKLCGFYVDLEREHHSAYTIDGNEINNADQG